MQTSHASPHITVNEWVNKRCLLNLGNAEEKKLSLELDLDKTIPNRPKTECSRSVSKVQSHKNNIFQVTPS